MEIIIIFLLLLVSSILISYIIIVSSALLKAFIISTIFDSLYKKGYKFKFIDYYLKENEINNDIK